MDKEQRIHIERRYPWLIAQVVYLVYSSCFCWIGYLMGFSVFLASGVDRARGVAVASSC